MNGMRDVSPAEGSRERTIRVAVGAGYDVVIGCGLLPDVGPRLTSLWRTRRVAVFTDSNVAALYLPVLETELCPHFFNKSLFPLTFHESRRLITGYRRG